MKVTKSMLIKLIKEEFGKLPWQQPKVDIFNYFDDELLALLDNALGQLGNIIDQIDSGPDPEWAEQGPPWEGPELDPEVEEPLREEFGIPQPAQKGSGPEDLEELTRAAVESIHNLVSAINRHH